MNNDTINVDISKKWQLLLWKVFLSVAIMFMVVEVIICLVKKDLGMARGAYMGLYVAIPLVIYAGVLSGTLYVLKKNKLTENGADWLVSMMMFVIFIVPAFEHYDAIRTGAVAYGFNRDHSRICESEYYTGDDASDILQSDH